MATNQKYLNLNTQKSRKAFLAKWIELNRELNSDPLHFETMDEENLTVVLKRKGEITFENRKIPEPSPQEALIAIHFNGICGSDVHFWKNGRIGDIIVKEPMVLGHESSGVVVKVGSNVKHLKPGDRVCLELAVPCRRCKICLGGRYNLCPKIEPHANPGVDGSLCKYYALDASFCYKLPDNVSLEEGALMEPLAVAVHACRRAQVAAGKSILICGAGAIGLLNLLVCRAMGASKICMTDICVNRLALAKQLGASHTICVTAMDANAVVDSIKTKLGDSPDVTIECSGALSSIRNSILVTKSGGTLMVVGFGASEVKIPLIEACVREVDIKGVYRYLNCYPIALDLVASGAVDVKPIITHRFKLKDSVQAFETAHSGANGAIKVLIQSVQ